MTAKGKKWLVLTGILEVIMGVASIAMILWILSQDNSSYSFYGVESVAIVEDALWMLVIIYGVAAIQIIAGLLGVIFANRPKHSGICQAFGIILIVIHVFNFSYGHGTFTVMSVVINIILILIPVLYFYGATLNKKIK